MTSKERQTLAKIALKNENTKEGKALAKLLSEPREADAKYFDIWTKEVTNNLFKASKGISKVFSILGKETNRGGHTNEWYSYAEEVFGEVQKFAMSFQKVVSSAQEINKELGFLRDKD